MADPVRFNANQHLDHLILFENAIREACKRRGHVEREPPEPDYVEVHTDRQAFEYFIDRLAEVCDNRRDQDTGTSLTVLESDEGPLFIFGSNQRSTEDLNETKTFVENLLKLAAANNQGIVTSKSLPKKVLWAILWFNRSRLQHYLVQLNKHLGDCIRDSGALLTQNLKSNLQLLKAKAEIPPGIVSQTTRDKFLSDCEKLIKAMTAMTGTPVYQAIHKNGEDGDSSASQHWYMLRYHLKRFLDFRSARDAIVDAMNRSKNADTKNPFQGVFENFKIISIPSSIPVSHAAAGGSALNAEYIIRNMDLEESEQRLYLRKITEMQDRGIDKLIQNQATKPCSRRYVHAEILVHDFCQMQASQPHRSMYRINDFWKGCRYIGSSKPTCRLCQYYFIASGGNVSVNSSRRKLYPSCRIPRICEDQDSQDLLRQITTKVEDDVKKALDKCPLREIGGLKAQFSRPLHFRSSTKDSATQTDEMPWEPRCYVRPSHRQQKNDSAVTNVELRVVRKAEADETDEEEDGGAMVPYAYY